MGNAQDENPGRWEKFWWPWTEQRSASVHTCQRVHTVQYVARCKLINNFVLQNHIFMTLQLNSLDHHVFFVRIQVGCQSFNHILGSQLFRPRSHNAFDIRLIRLTFFSHQLNRIKWDWAKDCCISLAVIISSGDLEKG